MSLVTLVGFPRSGTTWASNILNAHPSVVYRHEAIGRTLPKALDADLFKKLKEGNGLMDIDHERVIAEILRPNPEHDRPPFFWKDYIRFPSAPKLRWLFWAAATRSSLARRCYQTLYYPRWQSTNVVVLKETRSSRNLASILKGLRTSAVIQIMRNPYAVVASFLSGIQSGQMAPTSSSERLEWLRYYQDHEALTQLSLSEADIEAMSDAEFVALRWRVWNEDLRHISVDHLISYEQLYEDTLQVIEPIFDSMSLQLHDQVIEFLHRSKHSEAEPLLGRDAQSQYYSIYRGADFSPNRQATALDEETKAAVTRIVEASPVFSQFSALNPAL